MVNRISDSGRFSLLFELQQMFGSNGQEEVLSPPSPTCPPIQEMGSALCMHSSQPVLMQRLWSGKAQVNWMGNNVSDRSGGKAEGRKTAGALKKIQQRFSLGRAALPLGIGANTPPHRSEIIQLESDIEKTKDLIGKKELNVMCSAIADPINASAQSSKERLLEHQKEQMSVLESSGEALHRSEQDIHRLDHQQYEWEELSAEVALIKQEVSHFTKELSVANQQAIELECKRREEMALERQAGNLRSVFSDIRLEQEEMSGALNECVERQFEVDKQYEDLRSRKELEYPYLYATVNLSHQLSQVASRVNGQARAIPDFVRAASIFVWENFTHLAWKTVEAISNLGRMILQSAMRACIFVIQKAEQCVYGWVSIPALIAIEAVSLFLLKTTGSSFAFGVSAVSGYLLLRKMH